MTHQFLPGCHKPIIFLKKCPTVDDLIKELQELQKTDPTATAWSGDPDGDILIEGSTTNYIIQITEDPEFI